MVHPTLEKMDKDFNLSGGFLALYQFLVAQTETNYNALKTALINEKAAHPAISGVRYLVTTPDGTVIHDTGKTTTNTWANFGSKTVTDNHANRLAISSAFLSASGIGNETKFSLSTNQNENYYAVRVGRTTNESLGLVRYSFTETA